MTTSLELEDVAAAGTATFTDVSGTDPSWTINVGTPFLGIFGGVDNAIPGWADYD